MIIDERRGREEAEKRGLSVIGTLGVLAAAHERGLLDLTAALDLLRQARSNLERATSDKGGYRKKAIDEVNNAIDETKKGIDAGE